MSHFRQLRAAPLQASPLLTPHALPAAVLLASARPQPRRADVQRAAALSSEPGTNDGPDTGKRMLVPRTARRASAPTDDDGPQRAPPAPRRDDRDDERRSNYDRQGDGGGYRREGDYQREGRDDRRGGGGWDNRQDGGYGGDDREERRYRGRDGRDEDRDERGDRDDRRGGGGYGGGRDDRNEDRGWERRDRDGGGGGERRFDDRRERGGGGGGGRFGRGGSGGRGGGGGRFGRGGRGGGERRFDDRRGGDGGDRRFDDRRGGGGGNDRDRWVPEPEGPTEPVDPRILRSPRYLALKQLLRIEEQGAYTGLVNGSPAASGFMARRPPKGPGAKSVSILDEVAEEEGEGAVEQPLDPRDQRLIKELVAGVTRLQRRLDYVVSKLSNQTPSDFEAGVRLILRLGVFELMERELAPHAVNEHVQLAKSLVRTGAGSFVNGVLRSAARHVEAGTLPTPETEPMATGAGKASLARETLRRVAIQHSHPSWLASRWLARFGQEATVALMQRNNLPPVYTVRVNTLNRGSDAESLLAELIEAGVEAEPSPLLPTEFIRIRRGLQRLLADGFVTRGQLFVQDESAGLVVSLLDPQPGDRLLDCCAAPGGKTLFAAARMGGVGSITALDASASRLRALSKSAEAAGVGGMITVQAADLRDYARTVSDKEAWQAEMTGGPAASSSGRDAGRDSWERGGAAADGGRRPVVKQPESLLYDKVLLDAPCTGTGVLAKRADLRWRRTPENLEELVLLQDELLDAASALVKKGGVLVYSTCSMEEEEDHERVCAFLDRHPNFQVEHAGRLTAGSSSSTASGATGGRSSGRKAEAGAEGEGEAVAAAAVEPSPVVPASVVTEEGFVATLPHVHDTDGAFAARMRRLK